MFAKQYPEFYMGILSNFVCCFVSEWYFLYANPKHFPPFRIHSVCVFFPPQTIHKLISKWLIRRSVSMAFRWEYNHKKYNAKQHVSFDEMQISGSRLQNMVKDRELTRLPFFSPPLVIIM